MCAEINNSIYELMCQLSDAQFLEQFVQNRKLVEKYNFSQFNLKALSF